MITYRIRSKDVDVPSYNPLSLSQALSEAEKVLRTIDNGSVEIVKSTKVEVKDERGKIIGR